MIGIGFEVGGWGKRIQDRLVSVYSGEDPVHSERSAWAAAGVLARLS